MREINTSTLKVKVFDADPYLYERNVLIFTSTRSVVTIKVGSETIAKYSNITNRQMLCDLTGYVIANPNPSEAVVVSDGTSSVTITWASSGLLVNPAKLQRPKYPFAKYFTDTATGKLYDGNGLIIFAPTSTYQGDTFLAYCADASVEFSTIGDGWNTADSTVYDTELTTDTYIAIGKIDSKTVYEMPLRTRNCELQYMRVRWECGLKKNLYKNHTFEVYRNERAVTTSEQIYNYIDDGLALQSRAWADTITLRLDNLTAYDLWYYSDLLLSQHVYAEINGTYQRVQVVTKSITIPTNSTKREELLIEITTNKSFNL